MKLLRFAKQSNGRLSWQSLCWRYTLVVILSFLWCVVPAHPGECQVTFLKKGGESASYELRFLGKGYLTDISFSPKKKFFLVQDDHFRVIDLSGRERFALKRTSEAERPPMTHYVTTPKGVYDLSDKVPELHTFDKRFNDDPDEGLTKKGWKKGFKKLYRRADVVIYGQRINIELNRYKVFMRIDGQWFVFYLSGRFADVRRDFDLGTTIKGYPQKFEKMVYLRDPKKEVYSADSHRIRNSTGLIREDKFTYKRPGSLIMKSYEPLPESKNENYTVLPQLSTGLATYKLCIRGESMRFREYAVKKKNGQFQSNLYWFSLPESMTQYSNLSFIEFNPNSNRNTHGSDGEYVLRPKKVLPK